MRTIATLTVAAGLALSAVANAGPTFDPALDIVVDLGTFTVVSPGAGGDPLPLAVVFGGVDPGINPNDIVGFTFSGTASGVTGNGTWASDTRLLVSRGGVQVFDVGGLVGPPPRANDWAFQGAGSTNDGFYSSQHFFANAFPKDGTEWTLTFFHDWRSGLAAPITWTDATFTIHKIPTPGAAALLGLAGVAASRRRR